MKSKHANRNASVDAQISQIMRSMGMPANINGYHYLRAAIRIMYDSGCHESMTGTIYPRVAEMYSTTPACVERSMRHALKIACARGNSDVLIEFFAYTIVYKKKCPSNGEFVMAIADSLRTENGLPPCISRSVAKRLR